MSGPESFTPVSTSVVNGIAVFDGLSLSTVLYHPASFQVVITVKGGTFATLMTTPVTVDQAATAGVSAITRCRST